MGAIAKTATGELPPGGLKGGGGGGGGYGGGGFASIPNTPIPPAGGLSSPGKNNIVPFKLPPPPSFPSVSPPSIPFKFTPPQNPFNSPLGGNFFAPLGGGLADLGNAVGSFFESLFPPPAPSNPAPFVYEPKNPGQYHTGGFGLRVHRISSPDGQSYIYFNPPHLTNLRRYDGFSIWEHYYEPGIRLNYRDAWGNTTASDPILAVGNGAYKAPFIAEISLVPVKPNANDAGNPSPTSPPAGQTAPPPTKIPDTAPAPPPKQIPDGIPKITPFGPKKSPQPETPTTPTPQPSPAPTPQPTPGVDPQPAPTPPADPQPQNPDLPPSDPEPTIPPTPEPTQPPDPDISPQPSPTPGTDPIAPTPNPIVLPPAAPTPDPEKDPAPIFLPPLQPAPIPLKPPIPAPNPATPTTPQPSPTPPDPAAPPYPQPTPTDPSPQPQPQPDPTQPAQPDQPVGPLIPDAPPSPAPVTPADPITPPTPAPPSKYPNIPGDLDGLTKDPDGADEDGNWGGDGFGISIPPASVPTPPVPNIGVTPITPAAPIASPTPLTPPPMATTPPPIATTPPPITVPYTPVPPAPTTFPPPNLKKPLIATPSPAPIVPVDPPGPIDPCKSPNIDPCTGKISDNVKTNALALADNAAKLAALLAASVPIPTPVKVFLNCLGETPIYGTEMVGIPASSILYVTKLFEKIAETAGQSCQESKAIATVPEWWQMRPEANRPQGILVFKEIRADGTIGKDPYSITIPHCTLTAAPDSPPIASYVKGSFEGILTLKDNSKLIVNCKDAAECDRVINTLSAVINGSQLSGATVKIGERKGMAFKQISVKSQRLDFYPNGVKTMKPSYMKSFF